MDKKIFKVKIEWQGKDYIDEDLMKDALEYGLEQALGKDEKAKVIRIEEREFEEERELKRLDLREIKKEIKRWIIENKKKWKIKVLRNKEYRDIQIETDVLYATDIKFLSNLMERTGFKWLCYARCVDDKLLVVFHR